MNYQRQYDLLIHKAQARLTKIDVVERHHIIPKSMGGSNNKSNIVVLTPKEHYVAHHLLWKIHRTQGMHFAFWLMVTKCSIDGRKQYRVNSRTYQLAKERHRIAVSKVHSGKVRSIETRQKSSISLKGKPSWCKGLTGIHSESGIEKIRLSRLGKEDSIETRLKKSKSHTGVKRGTSPLKGKPAKPFDNRYLVVCPHCNMEGTKWNMERYHFDNCKSINPARHIESKSKGLTLTKHKCPHCNMETSMGNLTRWHLNNCKHKGK